MLEVIFAAVLVVILVVLLLNYLLRKKPADLTGKHVVVTGGSSGIGKAVAIEAVEKGANVTLIARNVKKLESAKVEILKHTKFPESQKVQCVSLDVSSSYEVVEKVILGAEDDLGPIFLLVNCAGSSICGKFEDIPVDNIKSLLDLNFLGTVYPTKAVVPKMKARHSGSIVIVSSQAALLGIYGFTMYCSSKFALRGLAEALQMEVKPYNISVTLALPPDTDTPGFAEEEKTKLMETRMISESAGLVSPTVVAKQIVKDALQGNFFSIVGFESYILTTLCSGMSPVSSVLELSCQVFLMGVLRFVGVFYLLSFHKIILKCMKTRDQTKKSE